MRPPEPIRASIQYDTTAAKVKFLEAAYAAYIPRPNKKEPPPILAGSPFEFQFGARYWYSSGNYQKDL
jgi:hypothetical protein